MKKFLFKFWIYILTTIHTHVNKRIASDTDELYVVYHSHLNEEIYICRGGEYALNLYNEINKFYLLTDRPKVTALYGKVDVVFRYKMVRLMNIIFCFEATELERQKLYRHIADVPLQNGRI